MQKRARGGARVKPSFTLSLVWPTVGAGIAPRVAGL
jgi:hypothetical protein